MLSYGKVNQHAERFLESECEPLYNKLRTKLDATQREVARVVYRRLELLAYAGKFDAARDELSELRRIGRSVDKLSSLVR